MVVLTCNGGIFTCSHLSPSLNSLVVSLFHYYMSIYSYPWIHPTIELEFFRFAIHLHHRGLPKQHRCGCASYLQIRLETELQRCCYTWANWEGHCLAGAVACRCQCPWSSVHYHLHATEVERKNTARLVSALSWSVWRVVSYGMCHGE